MGLINVHRSGEPAIAAVHHRAGERAGRRGAAGRGALLVDALLRRGAVHQDHGLPAPARLLAATRAHRECCVTSAM